MGKIPSSRSDESADDSRLSVNRRTLLAGAGSAVLGAGAIGAFSGSVAAWDEYAVRFTGCSTVWIMVGEADIHWRADADRDHPPMIKVVVERDGAAVCETILLDGTAETISRQDGDRAFVTFDAGDDTILAVIKYNDNQHALCYTENAHPCANTPTTVAWRDAECAADLHTLDADRFNNPCSEQAFVTPSDDTAADPPAADDADDTETGSTTGLGVSGRATLSR